MPLMLCGEWPPAPGPGDDRVSLHRGRLALGVRPAGFLVARSLAPLSPGGCGDIEVLHSLSASSLGPILATAG